MPVYSQFWCPSTTPPNQQSDGCPFEFVLQGPQQKCGHSTRIAKKTSQNFKNLLTPLFLMGCFPGDFREGKRLTKAFGNEQTELWTNGRFWFYDAFMTFHDEFCHNVFFARPLPGVPFWPSPIENAERLRVATELAVSLLSTTTYLQGPRARISPNSCFF